MVWKKILGIVTIVLVMGSTTVEAGKTARIFGISAALIGAAAYISNANKTEAQKRADAKKQARSKRQNKQHKKKVVLTEEMKIQNSLTTLGFYSAKVDGNLNSYHSRAAIKKMNIKYNISQIAALGEKEKNNLLFLSSLFEIDGYLNPRKETKKNRAKRLQASLLIHGSYNGKIDGDLGKMSRLAVAEYKNNLGLNGKKKLSPKEKFELINDAITKNANSIENTISQMVVKEKILTVLDSENLAPEEKIKTVEVAVIEEKIALMPIEANQEEMKEFKVSENTLDTKVLKENISKKVSMLDNPSDTEIQNNKKMQEVVSTPSKKEESISFAVPDED